MRHSAGAAAAEEAPARRGRAKRTPSVHTSDLRGLRQEDARGRNHTGSVVALERGSSLRVFDEAADFMINAEPDVYTVDLCGDDNFILLGCDGLFDELSNEEVCNMAVAHMNEHHDPQSACDFLAQEAVRRGSMDNVSVMLILLNRWWNEEWEEVLPEVYTDFHL